jgi:hypothetical protein
MGIRRTIQCYKRFAGSRPVQVKRVRKSLFAAPAFAVQDQGQIDVSQSGSALNYSFQFRIVSSDFFQLTRSQLGPTVTSSMGKVRAPTKRKLGLLQRLLQQARGNRANNR